MGIRTRAFFSAAAIGLLFLACAVGTVRAQQTSTKCDEPTLKAASLTTNNCVACIPVPNSKPKPVGKWCVISQSKSGTETNCVIDPGQKPGYCKVTYCTPGGECINASEKKEPGSETKLPQNQADLKALYDESLRSGASFSEMQRLNAADPDSPVSEWIDESRNQRLHFDTAPLSQDKDLVQTNTGSDFWQRITSIGNEPADPLTAEDRELLSGAKIADSSGSTPGAEGDVVRLKPGTGQAPPDDTSGSGQNTPPLERSETFSKKILSSTYGYGKGPGDSPNQGLAGGGTLDKYPYTIANNTDPIGTKYKVTNPESGESVVVEVRDRGPFIPGTTIPHPTRGADVGRAAAEAIGMGRTVQALLYEPVPRDTPLGPVGSVGIAASGDPPVPARGSVSVAFDEPDFSVPSSWAPYQLQYDPVSDPDLAKIDWNSVVFSDTQYDPLTDPDLAKTDFTSFVVSDAQYDPTKDPEVTGIDWNGAVFSGAQTQAEAEAARRSEDEIRARIAQSIPLDQYDRMTPVSQQRARDIAISSIEFDRETARLAENGRTIAPGSDVPASQAQRTGWDTTALSEGVKSLARSAGEAYTAAGEWLNTQVSALSDATKETAKDLWEGGAGYAKENWGWGADIASAPQDGSLTASPPDGDVSADTSASFSGYSFDTAGFEDVDWNAVALGGAAPDPVTVATDEDDLSFPESAPDVKIGGEEPPGVSVAPEDTSSAPPVAPPEEPSAEEAKTAAEPPARSPLPRECSGTSVNDCLSALGNGTSLAAKQSVAQQFGLSCTAGRSECNTAILGEIRKSGGLPVPAPPASPKSDNPYAAAAQYTGGSVVNFLKAAGQPGDFGNRAMLAQKYLNIRSADYAGTEAQNTALLKALRATVR